MVSVQVAWLPLTVGAPQVEDVDVGAGVTEVVMAWRLTGVAPAGMALTVMVKVCGLPTVLEALGLIEMLASTYCLTAGPLSPLRPSPVGRVTAAPPIVATALALAVKVPAVGLLMVSEQVAVLPPLLSTGLPQFGAGVPGVGLTGAGGAWRG